MFKIKLLLLSVLLGIIYYSSFSYARSGAGYPGYQGFNNGSHFSRSYGSSGGARTYSDPSARKGSLGGPRSSGGGLSGGK